MSGITRDRLERRILWARSAIGFERLWAALLWPTAIACLALALVFSGLLATVVPMLRLGFMALAVLAFLWSLRGLAGWRWPGRAEAMRRIEKSSSLTHRPVSSLDDRLVPEQQDSVWQAVWQAHRERQLGLLDQVKVGTPRSAWRDLDPTALRVPAALALLAALVLAPGTPGNALRQALQTAAPAPPVALALDGWIKPPAYTGQPPVTLTSPAMVAKLRADPELVVPENSVLSLRLAGAKQPRLSFQDVDATNIAAPELESLKAQSKTTSGVFQSEVKLSRPMLVRVLDGEQELAAWHILLVPDTQPQVAISEDPGGDASGKLTAKWKVSDDYGVTALAAELSLSDIQDGGLGIDGNGIFLYEPPKFPVGLRKAAPKREEGSSSADLAEHPWAGFMVDMVLTARDAGGHVVKNAPRTFRMPERLFLKPLARALIEQRKTLIVKPDEAPQVADMLEMLGVYPDGLFEGSGAYVMVAAIESRLRAARTQDDIDVAVNMLWQAAVGIEEGVTGDAKAQLEAVKRELEKALAEGAPPERIAELMDKMRKAMDRYLKSLNEEAQRQKRNGTPQAGQQGEKSITSEDLRKMLDEIQKMTERGDTEGAQQMLSQLEDILRNLKPGQQQAGEGNQQGDQKLGQMLNDLSQLMRKQQRLMDDTQRMQPPGEGDQNQQDGQPPGNERTPDGLAGKQGDLGQMLQELMKKFGQNGLDAPPTMDGAGKSMEDAQGALKRSDKEGALLRQGEAMNQLREGAKGLAKQLMRQGQGQQGTAGRDGPGRGGDDRDPLGRPRSSHGEDTGPNRDMVPGERAMQRAREILDALRSRMGEPQLAPGARSYFERLLRGLY